MHIVVTGAGGFVGQALVASLRSARSLAGQAVSRLTALDTRFAGAAPAEFERQIAGSIADAAVVAQAFEQPVDAVIHLASIPGGTAEQNYELGRDVNLGGTTLLLEAGRAQVLRGGRAPAFVFASTIGIFASPLPAHVDDTTPAGPGMTYGAQKLIGEILVSDFSRRGWVDGRSVRLPGVLARPPAPAGHMSAFMSDMIRELGAGRAITLPVRPEASTWASSLPSVVDNLLHAASLPAANLQARRSFTLPTLHFTFAQLVAAIGAVRGEDVSHLATWQPDARIEALFGSFPPLSTPAADAAGFRHDGTLENLVRRATQFG